MSLSCELSRIYCEPFFTNIGHQCVPYPDGCLSTNSLGERMKCKEKYLLLNNLC